MTRTNLLIAGANARTKWAALLNSAPHFKQVPEPRASALQRPSRIVSQSRGLSAQRGAPVLCRTCRSHCLKIDGKTAVSSNAIAQGRSLRDASIGTSLISESALMMLAAKLRFGLPLCSRATNQFDILQARAQLCSSPLFAVDLNDNGRVSSAARMTLVSPG